MACVRGRLPSATNLVLLQARKQMDLWWWWGRLAFNRALGAPAVTDVVVLLLVCCGMVRPCFPAPAAAQVVVMAP